MNPLVRQVVNFNNYMLSQASKVMINAALDSDSTPRERNKLVNLRAPYSRHTPPQAK